MIKAIFPLAVMGLLSLCLMALAYAYFGAVGHEARCSRDPNTCKNSYCAWPHCAEEER